MAWIRNLGDVLHPLGCLLGIILKLRGTVLAAGTAAQSLRMVWMSEWQMLEYSMAMRTSSARGAALDGHRF